MFVKICGMNSADAVEAAVAAGADALGFVFADSPRRVTPEVAKRLCANVPAGIRRVAVMRHPEETLWRHVLEVFAPDWLQTDATDLDSIELPEDCTALPVYRTGQSALAAERNPARLLFESGHSGTGALADWDEARSLAQQTQLMLAGGLSADNVREALRQVRPWGVDVSSGVERRRGEKDPAKITTFVARVRAFEE